MQRGSLPVNMTQFKKDTNKEAARVAFEWIKQIRREAYVSEIVEVIYNDNHDITELVRGLEKAPFDN